MNNPETPDESQPPQLPAGEQSGATRLFLDCPFCGSQDVEAIHHSEGGYAIRCKPCGAVGPKRHNVARAEDAWVARQANVVFSQRRERGLGERIECVRLMRHMSQNDLATKIGLKPMTGGMMVSHWECGRRTPHVKHLRAISVALNVSADYLLNSQ